MSSPSSPLERAVEVMDRLRSPGGCPWDAAQTHESLTPYLLEETYEVLEAIETGDPTLLREELGDLLLQVLFHARLGEELPPGEAFGIDEVAGDLVAKLIRRHPHVFAEAAEAVDRSVPQRAQRDVGAAQGRGERPYVRARRGADRAAGAGAERQAGRPGARRAGLDPQDPQPPQRADAEAEVGRRLFEIAREAQAAGVDPESALRRVAQDYRAAVVAAEAHDLAQQKSPDR